MLSHSEKRRHMRIFAYATMKPSPALQIKHVTNFNNAIYNDVADLCRNDQSNLLAAVLSSYPQLIDLVDINRRTLVHQAAEAGSWGSIEVLARAGAAVDMPDVSGETPLHRALYRHHLDASRMLLDLGANPNKKNVYGATPTLYAAQQGPDALDLLTSRGGDLSVTDNDGHGVDYWQDRGRQEIERARQVERVKPRA